MRYLFISLATLLSLFIFFVAIYLAMKESSFGPPLGGVSAGAELAAPVEVTSTSRNPTVEPEEVSPLEIRLARLETRLAKLEERLAGNSEAKMAEERVAELVDAALEARFQELQDEILKTVSRLPPGAFQAREEADSRPPEERIRTHQAVAIDRELEPRERLKSLRELRFLPEGRSPEVTGAMIEIIEDASVEARIRADVIRNLDGVTLPELRAPLIQSVLHDPDPEVREEAAETLGEYLKTGDLGVAEVLRQVGEADGANRVRREAQDQLEAWRRASEERR